MGRVGEEDPDEREGGDDGRLALVPWPVLREDLVDAPAKLAHLVPGLEGVVRGALEQGPIVDVGILPVTDRASSRRGVLVLH